MEMNITFPGGLRVDAQFGAFTVPTDQSLKGGGEGTAPSPFALFLASLGTCAGFYAASFCRQRDIPTEGIRIVQRTEADPETGMVTRVEIDILVPPEFPAKYYDALVRSANQCTVKKHLEHPPAIVVRTVPAG